MKVYTKTGDKGTTAFFGCGLIPKHDPRIEALGAFDELNSLIGVTLTFIDSGKTKEILGKIQHDLFQLGADLVGTKLATSSVPRITPEHIQELETSIDELQEKLGTQKTFILPGGTTESAFLHLCRAMTRRAERNLVAVKDIIGINQHALQYVNRLSDLLYMMARMANNDVAEQQPIYKYFEVKE